MQEQFWTYQLSTTSCKYRTRQEGTYCSNFCILGHTVAYFWSKRWRGPSLHSIITGAQDRNMQRHVQRALWTFPKGGRVAWIRGNKGGVQAEKWMVLEKNFFKTDT